MRVSISADNIGRSYLQIRILLKLIHLWNFTGEATVTWSGGAEWTISNTSTLLHVFQLFLRPLILSMSASHFVPFLTRFWKCLNTSHLTELEKVFNTSGTNESHTELKCHANLWGITFFLKRVTLACSFLQWMYDGTREKTLSPEKRESAKMPVTSEVSLVPFTFSIQALWRKLKPAQHTRPF